MPAFTMTTAAVTRTNAEIEITRIVGVLRSLADLARTLS